MAWRGYGVVKCASSPPMTTIGISFLAPRLLSFTALVFCPKSHLGAVFVLNPASAQPTMVYMDAPTDMEPKLRVTPPERTPENGTMTGFARLPFELRADIIKRFVCEAMPIEDPHDPIFKGFLTFLDQGLSTLELLYSHGIVDHITVNLRPRIQIEATRLAKLLTCEAEADKVVSRSQDAAAVTVLCSEDGRGVCLEDSCLLGPYNREDYLRKVKEDLQTWDEVYGELWFDEYLVAGDEPDECYFRCSVGKMYPKMKDTVSCKVGLLRILRKHMKRLDSLKVRATKS